ncbi:hypothetical protein BU25DRAFT_462164 [Macroventuria anomochaeta]|uniref:Uncharacterized protein n=1 Tax=Macroventuria anomochaeta TaxID=301207 RepID=A0ACB6RMV0_9PLEO|nr:uncharacterized protein BU25DRAFT_462164 [Macroventuria anomochaeta]KAF2623265.1 hypothetical protein BU25DRAFT_462164 [Macroventuria anomochaeta]
MFAAGKPVWYLPLAVFAIAALLFTVAELRYDRYIFANSQSAYPESLTTFLSVETITALKDDARLHHALLGLTASIAHTSSDIGQRYGFEGAERFGASLTDSIAELRKRYDVKTRKRGLVDDMSQAMGDLLGRLGVNTTGGLSAIVGNLGSALTDGLATPALFLGIGVGVGTSTGLNITDMTTAKAQALRVASTFNATATGINLAAQNIGNGLAGQLAPSLGQSGMMNISIGSAAYALASGIGNSTARALKLTNQEFRPSNDSSIEAVAGNLGLGVSTPIVSNIDFQAVMRNVEGSGIGATLMQQLPQIAAAAGNGLGEGTKNGLGFKQTGQPSNPLGKRQMSTDQLQGVDVPGAVNQFTKGFSQSLLTGVDVGSLTRNLNLTGRLGGMVDPSMFPALAAGAGSGIGMGLAIGFTFKSVNATPFIAQSGNVSNDNMQTAMVAETFAQNLVSNFLLNSTVLQIIGTAISNSTSLLLKNADVAKAAEGFARGTIEGVSTALSSVGGIQNLLSGNFSDDAMMNVPMLDATKFNDSVNGSAVSFARGFMGEGTILIGDVLKRINQNANNTSPLTFRKRSVNVSADEAAVVTYNALTARQALDNTSAGHPFPLAINEATIMGGGQLAIDMLTCQGIGGLASVALGAMNASKNKTSVMDMMSSVPLDPRVVGSLPQGPVEFTSEGNTFRIVLKDAEISINGLPIIPFGILTALHVLFIMLAFLLTLPLYLVLGVVWRLSVLAGYPVNEAKNKRWRLGLLITFGMSAVIGIAIGMVGMGDSRHFRDGHGVFGLIALILVFPTVGFTIMRLRSEALYPAPATFAGIKAPFALFKSPDQRIYIISGILIQLVFALGQLTFINGFSTLRSISLCVVDAVLTSNSVAGLMGLLLMVQITAAGMIGIRTWLEQHIAKREKAGVQRMTIVEAGAKIRKDSIATFGFDGTRSNAPPPLDLERPPLVQRNTEELKGFADEKISTPFNVHKEGTADSTDFNNPRQIGRQPSAGLRENPFLSPAEQRDLDERVYPKTVDYQYKYKSAIDDNTDYYNVPVGYQPYQPEFMSGRPSSDLIDRLNSPLPPGVEQQQGYGSPPKMQGVTTADLFPPPPPPPMDTQMQLTSRSASSSYSRPFNEGRRPSSDALKGFESGPRDTVRARRYS